MHSSPGFLLLKHEVSNTSIEPEIQSQQGRLLLNQRAKSEVCSDFLRTYWFPITASRQQDRSTRNFLDLYLDLTSEGFTIGCLLEPRFQEGVQLRHTKPQLVYGHVSKRNQKVDTDKKGGI